MKNGIQLTSWEALKAGIISTTKAMLKWLITNPAGQIALVVGAMAGLVAIYDALTTSLSEAKENLKESITTFNETTKEIKNLNSELETTESRIKELQKLSDAGTISIADEAELETLKEQNKELARQIALKQRQQITEGEKALKDAKELSTKTVTSKYEFVTQSHKEGTTTGAQVAVEKELQLAIDEYKMLKEKLNQDNLTDVQREVYEKMLGEAEARVDEMYNILAAERQAYLDLDKAGYTLNSEDKERLEYLNGYNDVFLLWNHTLTQTKQSFESLNAEQQRSILLNKLLQKDIEETYAKAIVDAISDSDLSEYWDKDFSFIPPQMTDYATAKEYGEAYAEAWLNGVQTQTQNSDEITVSLSDWLSSSFSKDQTYQQLIDSWKSDLKEMSTLLNDIRSGDTLITKSDAIAQFPDLKPYVEQFETLEIAVDNFIRDSYDELIKKFGNTSNIQGFGYEIQHLKSLLNEGLGGSNNIDKLNASFEELVNIRERINNGDTLSTEEMALLIDKYDALQDAVIETTNGYQIEDEALVKLINDYIQTSNTAISAQIEQTKTTIESILDRVKYYGVEAEALENIYNIYRTFGAGATGAPLELVNAAIDFHDANEELKELLGLLENNQTNSNKYKNITSSTKDTKETFDWIETLISRIQRNITNLGKIVSATYRNWSTRNNALAQEMAEVNKEISAQMTAYNAYMAKANSIPLAEGYKELARNGAYNISEITDEKLKEQIKEYEEWYEKALDCSDAIEDLRANLAELAMTKFNNISGQYDDQISLITHNISMLEGFVSQSEAAGYMASEAYYRAMSEKQQENVSLLQNEYSSLLSAFDEAVKNGSIEKYSSDWYDMVSAINDVELELQDATTQLIEFNQTLQQLSWESFDRVQGYISNIVSESEHLVDILDAYDLHTDKGIITDEGLAVQGLYAVNYNTYMEQALAYANEMAKIEEEMAKDPYDMELVDRRNELLGLQQEAIQNAMSEKEAIRDLVSDGYDKMLNSLDELINKRKEALQAEKDMYDYQNSISEKTNNIASLKKQLQAYSGDNSESAKATIQKLQVSLGEAEKDLQETEYEKYLSDQEQMLDALYDQTEQWVNERLDNLDGLVAEAVDATNRNAETINNTIHEAANAYGYKLSDQMETIWDYEENAIDGVCTIVSVYGDILHGTGEELIKINTNITSAINDGNTNVITAINNLNVSMKDMINTLNNMATANKDSIAQAQNAVVGGQNGSYGGNHNANDYTVSGGDSSEGEKSTNNSNSGTKKKAEKENKERHQKWVAYIGSDKIGEYTTEQEAKNASIAEINRRAEKAAKDASSRASGSPAVQIYNNVKKATIDDLTKKNVIKIPAYASGTPSAKNGLGMLGEDGKEIMIAKDGSILLASGATLYPFQGGEPVFNAKDTSEILNNGLTPLSINDFSKVSPNMSGIIRNTGGDVNQDINVNFSLPNVTDANSLINELQHDKRFEKIIQSMTADRMLGKNSLNKYKF